MAAKYSRSSRAVNKKYKQYEGSIYRGFKKGPYYKGYLKSKRSRGR